MALTLTATELGAERGGRLVFAGLSFAVRGGEALGITGPNGAGKSTLLRVLAGLLRPIAGRLALDPPDASDPDTPRGERAHYLGHADALKGALSAMENLDFARAANGQPAASPSDALRRVGLAHAEDSPCAYLSAGQRRRVALARLLISFRPVWLLDEPAATLDDGSQEMLAEIMRDHLASGGLIVAATHVPLRVSAARELRLGAA